MKRFTLLLVLLTAVAASADDRYFRPDEEPEIIELPGMTIIGNQEPQEPIVPTQNLTEVSVRMVWYDTKEELNRIYQRTCNPVLHRCERSVLAFTRAVPGENECEVHAMIPKLVDQAKMRVLGHEFSHCLFGAFHE